MCTELNKIHQDLNSIHRESVHLRKNIIRACKDHSAVHVDLFNSFNSIFELVNSLYTSIVNYETIHKFVSSFLKEKADERKDESYYIDRQYRKESFNFRSIEEDYRLFEERQQQRQKRCFVCNKEDC